MQCRHQQEIITMFTKGISGNPNGQPRGSGNGRAQTLSEPDFIVINSPPHPDILPHYSRCLHHKSHKDNRLHIHTTYIPHPAQAHIHKAGNHCFRIVFTDKRFKKTLFLAAEILDHGGLHLGGEYGRVAPTYNVAERGIEAFRAIAIYHPIRPTSKKSKKSGFD